MDKNDLLRQQQALFQEFAQKLPQRIAAIAQLIEEIATQKNDDDSLHELFRQVHSLSGSAPSFGYQDLGEAARALEYLLRQAMDNPEPPDTEMLEQYRQHVAGWDALCPAPESLKGHAAAAPSSGFKPYQDSRHVVYLVEDDEILGQEAIWQLGHFGYRVRSFLSVDAAKEALQAERPSALIVDIGLPEGMLAGPEFVRALRGKNEDIPVIFISVRGDWQARLAAVRAGGSAYLLKPINFPFLVSHLDQLLQREQKEPYRVLIVDDDQSLAQHYALVLKQAGMHAETLADPQKILKAVVAFRPELILMDLYMPDVSGYETAQVVRQHQELFSIPVVFLSTERDRGTQLTALEQGDDFIQKPISDAHLVKGVRLRAERSRALGRLMYHDGLTGLLNHSSLKQQLETEIARARRNKTPLSFVLVDIDRFKQVNDTYGHPAGDRVLKSLARLLQDRLRRIDYVGRYGGEEFGIILPEADKVAGVKLVEALRALFEAVTFRHEHTSFKCSLSAGLATLSANMDAKQLIDQADAALYEAKENGRNQVMAFNAKKGASTSG